MLWPFKGPLHHSYDMINGYYIHMFVDLGTPRQQGMLAVHSINQWIHSSMFHADSQAVQQNLRVGLRSLKTHKFY